MYGVVLWSDRSHEHAVIWCEDHGDLAFHVPDHVSSGCVSLAHGDVIAFELDPEASFRRICNVRLVDCDAYPVLARSLKEIAETLRNIPADDHTRALAGAGRSNVVPFAARTPVRRSQRVRRSAH